MIIKRLLVISISTFLIAGCSTFENISKKLSKFSSSQTASSGQVVKSNKPVVKKVNANATKKQRPVISNKCSYIMMDLSRPNSTAVWCVPNRNSKHD